MKRDTNVKKETLNNSTKSENPKSDKKEQKVVSEKKQSKNMIVCGDSILNGVDGNGISTKKVRAVVRSFPGATTSDMIDFIKPLAKKKPDLMIIHAGTNDLTKDNMDTVENFGIVLTEIKQESPDTEVILSSLCIRNDKPNVSKLVKPLNEKLKEFCDSNKIKFINNDKIDSSCLSKRKLHLNQKGLKNLALNMKECVQQ